MFCIFTIICSKVWILFIYPLQDLMCFFNQGLTFSSVLENSELFALQILPLPFLSILSGTPIGHMYVFLLCHVCFLAFQIKKKKLFLSLCFVLGNLLRSSISRLSVFAVTNLILNHLLGFFISMTSLFTSRIDISFFFTSICSFFILCYSFSINNFLCQLFTHLFRFFYITVLHKILGMPIILCVEFTGFSFAHFPFVVYNFHCGLIFSGRLLFYLWETYIFWF